MKPAREQGRRQKRIILKGPTPQELFWRLQKIRPLSKNDPNNRRLVYWENFYDRYLMEVHRLGRQELGWLYLFEKGKNGKIVTLKGWKIYLSRDHHTLDEALVWDYIVCGFIQLKKTIDAVKSKARRAQKTKRSRRS